MLTLAYKYGDIYGEQRLMARDQWLLCDQIQTTEN